MRLFVMVVALAAGMAAAEPVQLAYFDLPPFAFAPQGGPAFAMAQAMVADLDVAVRPDSMPIRRLAFEASKSPVIIAAIVRSPEREQLYQWIGRYCTDGFVIATVAPHPLVNSLAEARTLKSIAVAAGAANESFLRARGFTNLDPAASIGLEVRRLAEGHDEAWFAPRAGALHAWKEAGYDPAQLGFGAAITDASTWMAASKSVPAEMVKILRARFADKLKEGAVTGCPE